jgi:hypothetical protein
MYDYYSIEDILAENQVVFSGLSFAMIVFIGLQKITCIFKVDIADMGHLGGNSERDVRFLDASITPWYPTPDRSKLLAKSPFQYGLHTSWSFREPHIDG